MSKSFSTLPTYCEQSIIDCKSWPLFGEDGGLRTSGIENDRHYKQKIIDTDNSVVAPRGKGEWGSSER